LTRPRIFSSNKNTQRSEGLLQLKLQMSVGLHECKWRLVEQSVDKLHEFYVQQKIAVVSKREFICTHKIKTDSISTRKTDSSNMNWLNV
jgi:hypothetical protein